jgi:hypothetical protein
MVTRLRRLYPGEPHPGQVFEEFWQPTIAILPVDKEELPIVTFLALSLANQLG